MSNKNQRAKDDQNLKVIVLAVGLDNNMIVSDYCDSWSTIAIMIVLRINYLTCVFLYCCDSRSHSLSPSPT